MVSIFYKQNNFNVVFTKVEIAEESRNEKETSMDQKIVQRTKSKGIFCQVMHNLKLLDSEYFSILLIIN